MAGFQFGITGSGMALVTKGISGKEIRFTSVVLGDGICSGGIADAKAMVSAKKALPIIRIARKGDQVTVKAVLRFGEVESGFTWREVGLMALDPDSGAEVLYAYGTGGSDYIPGAGEATLDERAVQLTVMVSSADNITALLSPSAIFVDTEMLEEAIGRAVLPLTHAKNGNVHALSGLDGRSGMVSCCFSAAGSYVKGDTFTVENEAYTLKMQDGSEADDGLFVSGALVSCILDTEGKTVNFKAGGGVGTAALAAATATESDVAAGKTFFAGGKELRTGTGSSCKLAQMSCTSLSAGQSITMDVPGRLVFGCAYGFTSSIATNMTGSSYRAAVTVGEDAAMKAASSTNTATLSYSGGKLILTCELQSLSNGQMFAVYEEE